MSARVSSSRSKGNHAREPMQIGREEPSPSTTVTVSSSSEKQALATDPEGRSKTAKAHCILASQIPSRWRTGWGQRALLGARCRRAESCHSGKKLGNK